VPSGEWPLAHARGSEHKAGSVRKRARGRRIGSSKRSTGAGGGVRHSDCRVFRNKPTKSGGDQLELIQLAECTSNIPVGTSLCFAFMFIKRDATLATYALLVDYFQHQFA
jgi:hypothetical protein